MGSRVSATFQREESLRKRVHFYKEGRWVPNLMGQGQKRGRSLKGGNQHQNEAIWIQECFEPHLYFSFFFWKNQHLRNYYLFNLILTCSNVFTCNKNWISGQASSNLFFSCCLCLSARKPTYSPATLFHFAIIIIFFHPQSPYWSRMYYAYLLFVIFFTQTKFLENKIYTEIYTVNCQFTQ